MKQEVGTSPSTENKQASEHLGTHGALHWDKDTSASGRRDRGEDCRCADDAYVCLTVAVARRPLTVRALPTSSHGGPAAECYPASSASSWHG